MNALQTTTLKGEEEGRVTELFVIILSLCFKFHPSLRADRTLLIHYHIILPMGTNIGQFHFND